MNLFFRDIRWEKLIYLTNFKNEKFSSTYFTCFIYFRDLFDRTHFFFNMFGSDCKMAFTEQTHFEVLFEYRNVPQTHQQTGGGKKYRNLSSTAEAQPNGVILHFQMFSCLLFSSSTENKMLLKSWPVPKRLPLLPADLAGFLLGPCVSLQAGFHSSSCPYFTKDGGRSGEEGGKEQRASERDEEGENESKRRRW